MAKNESISMSKNQFTKWMSLGNCRGHSDVSKWYDVCDTLNVEHGRVLDGDIFGYNNVQVSHSLRSLVCDESFAREENSTSKNESRVLV